MTHTTTGEPTRSASGATVPVLAFAGIVVAVMQTSPAHAWSPAPRSHTRIRTAAIEP
ncbi:hypothetical protein ACWD4J_35975 [Streptomyces sp. NPDC002577]